LGFAFSLPIASIWDIQIWAFYIEGRTAENDLNRYGCLPHSIGRGER